MIYRFNTYLAGQYGTDEAIVLSMLMDLDEVKRSLNFPLDFFSDGNKTWVGFDEADFEQLLPFWSPEKCFSLLDSLIEKGALQSRTGRKKFYRFTDDFQDWVKDQTRLSPSQKILRRLFGSKKYSIKIG